MAMSILGECLSTKGKKIDVKREGWIVSALAEYKMESVTPGLTAWYSSGDDANVNNGSERLPTINPDVKVTSYGFDGTNFCRAQQVLGTSVDGTFGIVAHLKDISFFEDLSHTLRVAFYRGTNNTENVRQKMITKPSETVSSMYYMTTADKAWGSERRFGIQDLQEPQPVPRTRLHPYGSRFQRLERLRIQEEQLQGRGLRSLLFLADSRHPHGPAALPPPEPSLCPKSRPTRVNHTFYTRKETA